MLTIARVLIFVVVLFFYLHLQFHLKTSDDLEVYELESPSKEVLEEVCDARQPVRFSFDAGKLGARLTGAPEVYGAFDVKVRDVEDTLDDDEDPYVPLRLDQALRVMEQDDKGQYVSEGNEDFLNETGLAKAFRASDPFLRPYMVAACRYDYVAGSSGTRTPFRYEICYRTYFAVLEGKATVRLAPPKTSRYLYPAHDYCNFEFRSPVNPWEPQPQYASDFEKARCLDVVLTPGSALFIPARWWYSIEFSEPGTHLAAFRYSTYMSLLSTVKHTLLWALQSQNMQHRLASRVTLGQSQAPRQPVKSQPTAGDAHPHAAQPDPDKAHAQPSRDEASVASTSVPLEAPAS